MRPDDHQSGVPLVAVAEGGAGAPVVQDTCGGAEVAEAAPEDVDVAAAAEEEEEEEAVAAVGDDILDEVAEFAPDVAALAACSGIDFAAAPEAPVVAQDTVAAVAVE